MEVSVRERNRSIHHPFPGNDSRSRRVRQRTPAAASRARPAPRRYRRESDPDSGRRTDVRAAAGEQVRSLGATFLEVDLGGLKTEDAGGYAVELSEEALQRGREED